MTQQPQLEIDLFTPENELEQLDSGVSVSTNFVRRTSGGVQRSLLFTIAGYNLQRKGMEIPDSPTLTKIYAGDWSPLGPEFSSTMLTLTQSTKGEYTAGVTHRPRFIKKGTEIVIERNNSSSIGVSTPILKPYEPYNVSQWLKDEQKKLLLRAILGDHVFGPDGNLLHIYERYVGNSIYCLVDRVSEFVVVRGGKREPLSIYFYPISILLPSQNTSFRFARYNPTIQEPQIGDVSATSLSGVLPEPSRPQITHETVSVTPSVTSYEGIQEPPERVVVIREEDVPTGEQTIALARRDRTALLSNVVKPFRAIGRYILPEGMILDSTELTKPPTIGWFVGSAPFAAGCIYGILRVVEHIPLHLIPSYAIGTILSSLLGAYLGLKVGDWIDSRKERAGVEPTAIIPARERKDLQYPRYEPLHDPRFMNLLQRPELTANLSPAEMEIEFLNAYNTRFGQIKLASQKGKNRRAGAYAIGAVEAVAGYSRPIHASVEPEERAYENSYWSKVEQFWNQAHDIGQALEYAEGLRTHGAFGENLKNYKPRTPVPRRIGFWLLN